MKTIDELGISKTPWTECDFGVPKALSDNNGEVFVTVHATKNMDANTRLIAAAPDLYKALVNCVCALQKIYDEESTSYETGDVFDMACKAISKASGEEAER